MLKSLARSVLLCLLLVTIPAQAVAAVSMGICRALGDHSALTGSAAETTATHDHATHDHAMHEHAMNSASGHPSQAASDDGASSAPDAHHGAHCAACAACGASASVPALMATLALSAPGDRVIERGLPAPAGIVPPGLDRPPLPLLP